MSGRNETLSHIRRDGLTAAQAEPDSTGTAPTLAANTATRPTGASA
jgi:hypothetical protein